MSTAGSAGPERGNDGLVTPYLELRKAFAIQRSGHGGSEVCQALTQTMDSCLTALAAPLAESPVAVVALGGYGRAELCLYSDIDLMLLHAGRVPPDATAAIFYPLWNTGLKVGHAVRSVKEAVVAAHERLETLTALLDARLVAGSEALLDDLRAALGDHLRKGRISVSGPLAQNEQLRREREPYQLLEAGLKEGRGGLRALQSLHWDRHAGTLSRRPRPPVTAEAEGEAEALDTLLAFRNALHAVVGRRYDRYAFDLRTSVATWLGLDPDVAGRRLYSTMRVVDTLVTEHWSAASSKSSVRRKPGSGQLKPAFLPWNRRPQPDVPADRPGPYTSPLVLAAQTLDRPAGSRVFTPEEADLIRTSIGPAWDAAGRAALLRLLAAGERGWRVFTALEALGWVGRVLPEWRHVVAAPQHVAFHDHPLDVHLWRTVIELLAISRSGSDEPWCNEVAAELGSLDDALLAALLHDIGKGWPGDHSAGGAGAVAALLRRAGFGPVVTSAVTGAVRHHLLLPTIATRRDIDDPRVVAQVADQAGGLRVLRILYLLSVADARATGPSVWNPWKASLVRTLFGRVAGELAQRAGHAPQPPGKDGILQALKGALGGRVDPSSIEEHVQAMPADYLSTFELPELVRHVEAMAPPPQAGRVVVDVNAATPAANVIVVTEDRPGLLATIAGVLALHNVSVLGGRFYTRADGVVLDSFHVEDALGNAIEDRRWSRVREDMARAIRGELSLEALLHEKAHAYRGRSGLTTAAEVVVDADASDSFTVVEVHCTDRVGLLHTIARLLFELELDIRLAKVDTTGHQAVDTFYVCGLDGGPIRERRRLVAIEQTVRQRLVTEIPLP